MGGQKVDSMVCYIMIRTEEQRSGFNSAKGDSVSALCVFIKINKNIFKDVGPVELLCSKAGLLALFQI